MKRVFILLIALSYVFICNASHINEISSFEYSHKVMDHDIYLGSVLKYEDRIFLNAQYKIEELQILENGDVENISMYETKSNKAVSDFIDENRYYSIRGNELGSNRLLIFDVSSSPMILLSEIVLPFNGPYVISYIITENYIYFTDYQIEGSHRFNKETMQIDGFLTGLYGTSTSFQGIPIILFYHYQDGNHINTSFRVYNELQDDSEVFDFEDFNNEFFLGSGFGIRSLIIKDQKLFLLGGNVLFIYDLSDLNSIELIACVDESNESESYYFAGVDYYDDKIYTITVDCILKVYDINDGEVNNIFTYVDPLLVMMSYTNSLTVSYPYIYYADGFMLKVVDIINDYNLVYTHGKTYLNSSVYISKNNFYSSSYNVQASTIDFYSAFAEEPYMFSIIQEFDEHVMNLYYDFCINEDLLYFYYRPTESDFYVIDLYQIVDNNLVYLNQELTNFITWYELSIRDNLLILRNSDDICIYEIENNELEYLTSFAGKLIGNSGIENDYLIYKNNNQLCFRDFNNIEEVSYNIPISSTEHGHPFLINEDYLSFYHILDNSEQFALYSFDLFNELMSLTDTYYGNGLNTFKGFLTDNCQNHDYSIYYNLYNGEINEIGQKYEQRYVDKTFIYPELHKMIQYTRSGMHVYDIEYTVSSSDQVVEYERETYVYPNPVNGGDVNFKTSLTGNDTEISIYNIKGQLVKTSKAFQTKANESIFTWDKRNNQNQSVASGVYFYKIKTDTQVKTGKFLIMK
jgi:hypothetical protein